MFNDRSEDIGKVGLPQHRKFSAEKKIKQSLKRENYFAYFWFLNVVCADD